MYKQSAQQVNASELTLPSIVGRLSRLEREGFSYHELLPDFACRRRVVTQTTEERPGRHAVDTAKETEDLVQAYLHLTQNHPAARWKGALLGQHRRNRFASCKLAADISYKEQQEPGTREVEFGDRAVRTWRDVELARDDLKSGTRPKRKGHNVNKHNSRQQMDAAQEVAPDNLRVEAHDELFSKAGGGKRQSVAETPEVTRGAFEGHSSDLEEISTKLEGVEQKRRPRTSLLESLVESSRPSNLFEFYPSQRPSSAKAKATRLENAAQTFSAQAFKLNQRGGLYSTLSRNDIGLTQKNTEGLMATVTDQKEAITGRVGGSDSLVATESLERGARRRQDFISTTNTPYIHDPIHSGTSTRKSVQHIVSPGRPARHETKRPRLQECSQVGISKARPVKVGYKQAVSDSPSVLSSEASKRLYSAERTRHQANVTAEICGLRALLGKSHIAADGKAGSPLHVKDLRLLRASKRLRDRADLAAKSVVVHNESSCVSGQQQEKKDGCWTELHADANCLLRTLGKALLSSLQARIQKKFLLLGFHKWQMVHKAAMASIELYRRTDAAVLVQSYVRRGLSIIEASERRRLRNQQGQGERLFIEAEVRRRQEASVTVQRWIRAESANRRAQDKKRQWRAARVLQQALRLSAARTRAIKLHEEEARNREEVILLSKQQQRVEDEAREILRSKTEALVEKEILFKQRQGEFERIFRREGAAIRIQAVWRARVLKSNLDVLLRTVEHKRAIRIQRTIRGFLAKNYLRRRKEGLKVRLAKVIAAAVKIQGLARRYIAWNKVEAKRFERRKEQLVSTLDAQHALREQKYKVPLLKAIAERQGLVSASEKGQPYIIDIVGMKILIAEKKRAINPWQETTDRRAATKIQAVWRGFRQVRRVRRMQIRRRRERFARHRARMTKAAGDIQRIFRGIHARAEAKSRRYGQTVVKIQKVWRGFLGKRIVTKRRKHIQAVILLQRILRAKQARVLKAQMVHKAAIFSIPATTIQAAIRRHLAQRLHRTLVVEKQIEGELIAMAEDSMNFCAERARLRIIVEGAAVRHSKGDGVTQCIFRNLAVKRNGEGGSSSLRMEGRTFYKLFTATPRMFNASFRQTDVDVTFAKVKDMAERTITYEQFIAALNMVAAALFPATEVFRNFNCFSPTSVRLLKLVDDKILQAPSAAEYRHFSKKAGDRFLYRSAAKIQAIARGRLGRKRFAQSVLERENRARDGEKDAAATVIQAVARMFRARTLAIHLAKIRIAKYIDPSTLLPYWVHGGTGIASWEKPKIFRGEDVDSAMMVASSKTEHLVMCSVCLANPVKRVCFPCRDSFCEACFQALHKKGHRRAHPAPTVQMCCVCKYQHATRLCETCTSKTGSSCAYCDVCFFSRHPGLAPPSNANAERNKARDLARRRDRTGSDHSWTALVVMCAECRSYAARWLCDDCEEVYCTGCYASVHSYGTKANHGADKLPYYTANFHMEYAMACKLRGSNLRDEETRALRMREKEGQKERAATLIQARWRGRVGRIKGRAVLKSGRLAERKAWRQRKRDERVRNALWYRMLGTAGFAPRLKSDKFEERVLRVLPRMARNRARRYIALNRDDDAWVPERLNQKKGTAIKRGFDVGNIEELVDQARHGGVRLPGRYCVKRGERCVYTDPEYDLKDLVRSNDIIRLGNSGKLFHVEDVQTDRIRIDHIWYKPDADNLLLYKLMLNQRQKLFLRLSRKFWSSQPVQLGLQAMLVLEGRVIINFLRNAAKHSKKNRHDRLYRTVKEKMRKHKERFAELELQLDSAHTEIDGRERIPTARDATDAIVVPENKTTDSNSGEARMAWVEHFDEARGRPFWQNRVTGEVSYLMPQDINLAQDLSQQKEEMMKKLAKKRGRR